MTVKKRSRMKKRIAYMPETISNRDAQYTFDIVKAICTVSDRVVVLNMGAKIAEGPPMEIINNPQVIDVYLGRARA